MKDINEGIALYRSTPDAVLVDLRDPEDYEAAHIPGAISMKQESIREDIRRVAKFSTPIFLYDYNEKRADPAEAFLRSKGYTEARSIGGIIFYNGEMEKPELTIRELREKRGLTQAQFAQELGVSAITVSSLETGRLKLSDKMAARIREQYDERVIQTPQGEESKQEKKPAGEAIRDLRDSLGMTREAFAKSLGMNANTIYEYESGRFSPSPKILTAIKKKYGVKIAPERDRIQRKKVMNRMDVREIRTALGLSQAEFARQLGVATASIGHYENGRMNPSEKVVAQIKSIFGSDLKKALNAPPTVPEDSPTETPAEPGPKPRGRKKAPPANEIAASTKATPKPRGRKKAASTVEASPASPAESANFPRILLRLPSGVDCPLEELLHQLGPVDSIRLNLEKRQLVWIHGKRTGVLDFDDFPTSPASDA